MTMADARLARESSYSFPFSAVLVLVGLTLAIDSVLSVVRHSFAAFPVSL